MTEMTLMQHALSLAKEYGAIATAVVLTIAGTNAVKVLAAHWYKRVTRTRQSWKAFCVLVYLVIGHAAGVGAWLSGEHWSAIFIVGVGSGLVWTLGRGCLKRSLADRLLTDTDRKFLRERRGQ